jgi:Resolvase, N terminal domain
VPSLDRLSRSLRELITSVGELRRREVGVTSLHESLDSTTPGGRLVFHVFAALAEFIRELMVAGTQEGARCRSSAGPRRRPALGGDARHHPGRAGHVAQPRTQHHLDREAAGASAQAPSTTTSPTWANSALEAASSRAGMRCLPLTATTTVGVTRVIGTGSTENRPRCRASSAAGQSRSSARMGEEAPELHRLLRGEGMRGPSNPQPPAALRAPMAGVGSLNRADGRAQRGLWQPQILLLGGVLWVTGTSGRAPGVGWGEESRG